MNKVEIIMVTLDEFGEEKEKVIKECDTKEEAENFVLEHEQEYTDNPEVYSVYIQAYND